MVDMSDEWSAEEISRLLVAVKAINHDCQKKNHNVAIICTAWNMGEIMKCMRKDRNCYVQPAFCHIENSSRGKRVGMVDSVKCIAVGYFGEERHFSFNHDRSTKNMWMVKADSDNQDNPIGTGILAAVNVGRHCVYTDRSLPRLHIVCDILSAVMDIDADE
ncbi:uncharacterized protein [Ptychodera flava]|uniref:uncharacterized protein n=1 Tax=Ptychodera flava TaxID=63121 RepID=UPI00396A658A